MTAYRLKMDHMEAFRENVRAHLNDSGLKEWLVDFDWIDDNETAGLAETEVSLTNRTAVFRLHREWVDVQPTEERLDRIAYHEVLELMLAPLRLMATSGASDEGQMLQRLNSEAHAVIRRLENVRYGEW